MSVSKKKILFISDHPLSVSGVGTQARFLINGLIETGKYSFRCLGAALKHENLDLVKVNDDLMIKPIEGFGNQELIRALLLSEKPDALFIFTDPRFFNHIFLMHDEIQQICPLVYWHLWDDSGSYPPSFNNVIYEICDAVNCINWPTFDHVNKNFPNKTKYVPHAVAPDLYKRLPDEQRAIWRKKLVGEQRMDHFISLFVGRNARRKRTSDVLVAWKIFLDELQVKHGHRKATLVMHTNPFDHEGPNLTLVMDHLGINDNVIFSNNVLEFSEMNGVYNAVDCMVNISIAEGFGLPILEAKMAEVPCIAVMTGGLTRQIQDHESDQQFGIALKPDVVSVVGNQGIPWIGEDFVSNEHVAEAFMKMYETPREERRRIGILAREHCMKNYDLKKMINDWDKTFDELFTCSSPQKRWSVTSV